MMSCLRSRSCFPIVAVMSALLALPAFAEEGFYKKPNLFNFTHADEKLPSQSIDRFGPVGMSIDLRLPPFQMYVGKIEEGSPAEATGRLKTGQKIESINGQTLKDIDPRIQLAKIITDAESTDGKIRFLVWDEAEPYEVVVTLPVLGAYSKTWPLNCPKSDRIVRNMADWVRDHGDFSVETENWASLNGFGMLFMLSTGEEKDLEVVRGWVTKVVEQYRDAEKIELKPWVFGPAAIPLAEYYLRTGDASILPVIQKIADHAAATMYNGGWSGRGGLVFGYMVGGHLNAAGVHVPTFLLLAKECGVDVDEVTLQQSLRHFYRFAGKGSLAYGDGFPETYFIDNGKTGALAFTMAAAASLTPDGEDSVYAKARDISAMRGFHGTNYMLVGHTGGGIGEVWRGPAMGLLYDKEPRKYRAFMDGRQWHLEMSRRFDGSFGILDGYNRYDGPKTWGQMMALQYTAPRKTLRLTGAPRTKWSKPYKLPERPWGTAADDDFFRTEPAAYADGKLPTFDDTLEGGTINGIERHFRAVERTEELVHKYCLHPDHEVRREIGAGYTRGEERDALILVMLKHKDARVRRAGLSAIHMVHKGTHVLPAERLTDEMAELVIDMVNDPEESWWVQENALRVMSVLPKEKTAPHLDRLLYFLGHEEWWLQHASLIALAPLAVDEAYYEKIMPEIAEMIVRNTHAPATQPLRELTGRLKTASPKVREAGLKMFGNAYAGFPGELHPPAGQAAANVLKGDMKKYVLPTSLRYIAEHMMDTPGGYGALFEIAKRRHPEQPLPYKQNYLRADPSTFTPDVREALKPIILDQLVPDFVARNLRALRGELAKGGNPAGDKLTELAGIYKKAGIDDYGWHKFGPDRDEMKWHYHSFDPEEKRDFMPGQVRYRKVTFPSGMEKWYMPQFDATQADWKIGLAPFGQDEGKLGIVQGGCMSPICRCGDPMKTFWEHEVLMIKGKFKFPPMKEGYSYRLIAGGAVHVGNTDGPVIYVNGRPVANATGGIGRGRGGRPRGALLPPEMKTVFDGGEVEIAAIAFLRMHKRHKTIGNFLTVWMEEMKNPPVTDDQAWSGLTQIPMQSSAWQQAQSSDVAELVSEEGLFRFDGEFVANDNLLGTWRPMGMVAAIDAFEPGGGIDKTLPRYRAITFKENGFTDTTVRYWSGNVLMEVPGGNSTAQALKMKTKTIDGSDYLFIEAGGFTYYSERQTWKQPRTWKSPWFVLKK